MIWTLKHDANYGERGVQCYEGRKFVGEIVWFTSDFTGAVHGEIASVFVYSEFRRRGIATELLRLARLLEPGITHSTIRSPSGDAWARSTGDPLPPMPVDWAGQPFFERCVEEEYG